MTREFKEMNVIEWLNEKAEKIQPDNIQICYTAFTGEKL